MRRFNRGLRGLAVNDIFSLVRRTERQIDLLGSNPQPFVYRRIGSWLIQSQYLNSFQYLDSISYPKRLDRPKVKIPDFCIDLSPKGALKLISAYLFSERLISHTSAEAIRIKNNIRTFYINSPLPFSSKIMFGKTRSVHDMKREIDIRSKVASYNRIKTPGILQYDLDHDPPFFCEEIIAGRKADPVKDGSTVSEKLCPQLWQNYERQGITFRKIQDIVGSDDALKKLEKAIGLIEWNSMWHDRKTFFQKARDLLKGNFTLPCSTGHGDLSLGNMIITPDEQVYIVDWECSKEMPILFDLLAIIRNVPRSRNYFQARIEEVISGNINIPILSFREQCFLAVLAKIFQWERSQRYRLSIGAREHSYKGKLFNYFSEANALLSEIPSSG